MAGALSGKVALVTGASSGIGEATALALAGHGATVAILARRRERLDALAARIEAAGGEALALPGDVAEAGEAARAVTAAVARFGRLDILVNAAGIIRAGGAEALPAGEWREVMDVNLMGTLHCCQAAIAPMKAQGGGQIVNISSLAARRPSGALGAYAASKFAVSGFSESLRQELAPAGIRVCTIEPGQTRTELANGLATGNGQATAGPARSPTDTGLRRQEFMEASDIAAAVCFVVSLPPRANVAQLLILPAASTAAV
ncbi:SDR family oxidoreductase [Novosphingobium album (ex Liu et al. 2023)]|uniref:SDR family NAD(P)-dependent oxidoreductase n=1 Tax=Novosphingobium album (ex Liu et al. 2023) TaxID=3031130 RepID=A0ABT5WMD5_9SPHN|nr:SDR family NAD(P)-dependent oxidoreductase [Novosphingobium album (ex Liu et al. 2023)]MDE8651197.1 SDR family NAD(P)-dependent oxidoreductase [Novosphingobium album (ex Liu et al. 2023)]